MSIMTVKDLKKKAPKGEFLAYINKEEAAALKRAGGSGHLVNGIPSFVGKDYGDQARGTGAYSGQSPTGDGPTARELGKRLSDTQAQAKANTDKKEKERQDAIKADIAKRELEKLDYAPKNVFEKIGAYNRRYKQKFVARQKQKQKLAVDKFLEKVYGTNSPRMIDIAEVRDQLMSQYDPSTNTMKGLEGFNIGKPGMNYGPTQLGPLGLKTTGVKGQPLGTKYMDTTPSLYSHPSNTPSIMGQILGKVSPPNINNLMSSFNKINQLSDIEKNGVTQSEINDYYDRAQGKGKYDIFGGGNGDGQQSLIPIDYNTGAGTTEDVAEDTTFDYRFGNTQGIGRDVTLGYLAKGGRAGKAEGGIMELRARRAFGGIMDRVTGRKAYGLGSIFKKIGKAAKKVLSSDIGKAAIIGAGIYYGGGGRMPFTKAFNATKGGGFGGFELGNLFSSKNKLLFNAAGEFNPWKAAGLITAGGAAMGPAKVDTLPGMNNRGGSLIDPITGKPAKPAEMRASLNNALDNADGDPIRIKQINDAYAFLGPDERLGTYSPYRTYGVKDGGRIGKAEGGLMDLGGMEKDYRAEGGFVPIGEYEKKDDVPARLSVNEFVFTADAVRGAGQGDIDKGAEIMENMMVNLEKGGTVSEESQGNAGAQQMFDTSERLGEVI